MEVLQQTLNSDYKDSDEIGSDENVARKVFVKNFTEKYDEFGTYFPEYLRLKEL